jgi:hypothetical protein
VLTLAPTSGQSSSLHFDLHQFQKKARAVSADTCVDWSDYSRMGIERHFTPKASRWIPTFAANAEQLKNVLLERQRRHDAFPLNVDACAEYKKHQRAVNRCGGNYLAFITAIAWRGWRMRWDCRTIANEMEISPAAVRVHLNRLVEIAREFGFETFSPHWTKGWRKPPYVEGTICWECKRRPVNKACSKWRCTKCLELTARKQREYRKRRAEDQNTRRNRQR